MSRFDLYRGNAAIDYYLNVQHGFHDHLKTRMVIPAIAKGRVKNPTRGLHIPLTIYDKSYYLVTPMMAALPTFLLGKPLFNLAEHSHDITAAVDFLLQGF